MKKLLVVLLSLGLIVGISATASALDVSFSGSYQVEGAFESNAYQSGSDHKGFFGGDTSRAAVWQRFRLMPVFKVAEGLTMTVRLDALEKQWGNSEWRGGAGTDDYTNSRRQMTAPGALDAAKGQKVQENIEFERSYVTFATAIGVFDVGYQKVATWGTGWGDYEQTGPRVKFTTQFGPVALLAIWDKTFEADAFVQDKLVSTNNKVDADIDAYSLAAIYSGKGIEAGLLYKYTVANYPRLAATPYKSKIMSLLPYMKATFGPVYIEAELGYGFGKSREMELATVAVPDQDVNAYGGYIKAKVNMGPAYFGGSFGMSSGDDFQDAAKKKNLFNAKNWNPTLIMLADDYLTDIFPGGNAYDAGNFSSWKNAPAGFVMYNVFGGFNPTPKLNVELGVSMASFDKAPRVGNSPLPAAEYVSKTIGTEVDLTATYKLYDNLSYMIGAGYLFTGDAFKGNNANATVGNDYMLMNRLALSF